MSGGLLPTANFLYPGEPEKACFLPTEYSLQGIVFEDPEILSQGGNCKKAYLNLSDDWSEDKG